MRTVLYSCVVDIAVIKKPCLYSSEFTKVNHTNTENMQGLRAVVPLLVLFMCFVALTSANMFGAGNALNKRFPGSVPISYEEFQRRREQHLIDRQLTVTQRPVFLDWNFPRNRSPPKRHIPAHLSPGYYPMFFPNEDQRPIVFPSSKVDRPLRPVFLSSPRNNQPHHSGDPHHSTPHHDQESREIIDVRSAEAIDASIEYE